METCGGRNPDVCSVGDGTVGKPSDCWCFARQQRPLRWRFEFMRSESEGHLLYALGDCLLDDAEARPPDVLVKTAADRRGYHLQQSVLEVLATN